MAQVTLNIPNGKLAFFMELIKSLDFVEIQEKDDASEIPSWQINETLRRSELVKKGEIQTSSWEDVKKNLLTKK